MTRSTAALLVVLGSIAATLLSGCEGCTTQRHASAQGPDGGAVLILPGPSPSSTATCFVIGARTTGLVDGQVEQLCFGAPTPTGPVDCYRASRRLTLSDDQRIGLCRCASSAEPVACFRRVDSETGLTDLEIQVLCSPSATLGLYANCRPVGGGY